MFDIATEAERFGLNRRMSEPWGKKLSDEVFLGRCDRLNKHLFGRKFITTYIWKEKSEIVSSLDALEVDLIVNRPELKLVRGVLIANVITPVEHRKKGHATELLKSYFKEFPEIAGVLYSDIGPGFYRRFGFHESPISSLTVPAGYSDLKIERVGMEEGIKQIDQKRWRAMRDTQGPALSLQPNFLFLDWQIERYRYFAEVARHSFPSRVFYRWGESWALAVPHFLFDQVEVFWMNELNLDLLNAIARDLGVSKIVYWGQGEGKVEYPMARNNRAIESLAFLDAQLIDWW